MAHLAPSLPTRHPIHMSDLKRNYELAFHINPNLEEARISQIKSELEKELMAGGSTITYAKDPERTRLSYPIGANNQAYFGYIQFQNENGKA